MTPMQIIALLTVSQDLIETGKATWAAIKQAMYGLGATPEQFDAAEATLTEIRDRRRNDANPPQP